MRNVAVARALQAVTYWPIRLALKFFTRYYIRGVENLRGLGDGPIIFASNHGSMADGPISASALPRRKGDWYPRHLFPIRFLAWEGFMRARYLLLALYIWANGSIKIKNEPKGNLPVLLGDAVNALKQGAHVWIYPEGKRSPDGRTKRGKRGIVYLQEQTGAPIVPVGIRGNISVLSFRLIRRKKRIRVKFGKPLYTLKGDTVEEKANFVAKEISRLRR